MEGLRAWREGNRGIMAARAVVFRSAMAPLAGWQLDALGGYFAYLRLPDWAPPAGEAASELAARHGLMTLPGPFFGPGRPSPAPGLCQRRSADHRRRAGAAFGPRQVIYVFISSPY